MITNFTAEVMGNDITDVTVKLSKNILFDVNLSAVSLVGVTDWGKWPFGAVWSGKVVSCPGYIRLEFMI